MPSVNCVESWIVSGLIVEVLLLILIVPAFTKVLQWNEVLSRESHPTLLKIRQWRKELRYLREAVEELDVIALPCFFKKHPLGRILGLLLPLWTRL